MLATKENWKKKNHCYNLTVLWTLARIGFYTMSISVGLTICFCVTTQFDINKIFIVENDCAQFPKPLYNLRNVYMWSLLSFLRSYEQFVKWMSKQHITTEVFNDLTQFILFCIFFISIYNQVIHLNKIQSYCDIMAPSYQTITSSNTTHTVIIKIRHITSALLNYFLLDNASFVYKWPSLYNWLDYNVPLWKHWIHCQCRIGWYMRTHTMLWYVSMWSLDSTWLL